MTFKPMSEFYLTTMWRYHPAAAKRIIDEMNVNCPGAQIMYVKEFHWFKVNCPLEDQRKITELFAYITADVEDDAFNHNPANLLDADGRIKQTFENELIAYENDSFDPDWVLNALEDYTFPAKLASFPFKDVWARLEDESLTVQRIVSRQEFGQLQTENDVAMEYDSPGKLVYIASHAADNIRQVKEKLQVILEYRKLPKIRTEHLLYSDGYVEAGGEARDEFLADIRYLANIHPKLPVSTLLDPACTNLDGGYRKLYQQGASVRLCKYDEARGRHFSMYGPEVKGRGGMKYPLGNRPPIFVPNETRHGRHTKRALSITEIPSGQEDKDRRVSQWIKDVPTQSAASCPEEENSADEYYTATPTAYPESSAGRILDDIRSVVKSSDSREGKKEQIMTLVEELVNKSDKDPSARAASPSVAVNFDETLEDAIQSDRPLPLQILGATNMPRKSFPEAPTEARSPNSENPKPRQSPPQTISWSMAPLVPERVYVSASPGPSTRGNDENKKTGFKRYNSAGAFNTMDQNGKSHRPNFNAQSVKTTITKNLEGFNTELSDAMGRLLSLSPYQRGRVSVRADFGRIILAGMDQSALAFNNPRTPSNGWKKQHLVSHLNRQVSVRERIHFTKILSTFGSDLEYMINTPDLSGKRIWQPTPARGWVVYSFRAIYVHDTMETNVLINCIFGDEGKTYTYDIAPFNSTNDGVTPLYVHGLLHNWDLRITMTSFDSRALESGLGSDVRKFLDTVQVLKIGVDRMELRYFLHEKTPLKVQETRVLTKWRYSHSTMKSELEITEVESLSTTPVSRGTMREYLAQTPTKKEQRFRQAKGCAARWYEASVVSTTMERLFGENETLGLGEKTSWDTQTLRKYEGEDVFAAIYAPALQMLRQMDQVGGNDTNNMPQGPEYEVRKPNEVEAVPGYTRDTRALTVASNTSAASTQAGWGRLGERRPSTSAGQSTASTQPQQQGQRREKSNQTGEETQRRLWTERMERVKRDEKVYW
ncbi:hypothetical protein V8F06_000329 [Rhypophila decipiens]